jgi:hypothetical protein
MTDFYLDPTTHDFVFENGDIKWVPTQQELCRQNVVVAMKTFRGEWFRDIGFGVPWLENENNPISLLGGKDKFVFDAELRKVILNESTVISISSYKTTFEPISGQINVDINILSEFGPINISTNL